METLWQRQAIRQHMMAGDIESANTLLMQHFPELVVSNGGARPDLDVYFYVNCMQFIELIRYACGTSLLLKLFLGLICSHVTGALCVVSLQL